MFAFAAGLRRLEPARISPNLETSNILPAQTLRSQLLVPQNPRDLRPQTPPKDSGPQRLGGSESLNGFNGASTKPLFHRIKTRPPGGPGDSVSLFQINPLSVKNQDQGLVQPHFEDKLLGLQRKPLRSTIVIHQRSRQPMEPIPMAHRKDSESPRFLLKESVLNTPPSQNSESKKTVPKPCKHASHSSSTAPTRRLPKPPLEGDPVTHHLPSPPCVTPSTSPPPPRAPGHSFVDPRTAESIAAPAACPDRDIPTPSGASAGPWGPWGRGRFSRSIHRAWWKHHAG